ncbi:hypothetical protein vBSlqSZDD2_12 [Serratia phage vB_SlqS_ZDD2]|nr:hypothetical protein vBSlqSZDD2_12 [Serratia phage vB_SlqS_ZDD2]
MLKLKITKEEHAALDESLQGFYSADGEGFALQVSGVEDTSGLKNKNTELLEKLRVYREKEEKAQEEARKAQEERDRKAGNWEKIENSYKEQIETLKQNHLAELEKTRGTIKDLVIGKTVTELCAELAVKGKGALLKPFIESRLALDEDGVTLRILDAKGSLSAMDLDALKKELRSDKLFDGIIVGTQAQGSGGTGGRVVTLPGDKKASEYTEEERMALLESDPAKFDSLFGA